MAKKSALGRGVSVLIPEYNTPEEDASGVVELKLVDVEPNREQPRKRFDREKLEALTESVRTHGVIQPILVVKKGETYEIVAGERRWRAAKAAGLKVIPAIVRDYDRIKVMEVALIENLQREDLNPVEEAQGYKSLMQQFSMTQEQISERVGKSRSAVANALRLLNLPEEVLALVEAGTLSGGHAKAILGLQNQGDQMAVAQLVIEKGLSVRQVEQLIKNKEKPKKTAPKTSAEVRMAVRDLERELSSCVGTKVKIKDNKGKGRIEISYYSHEELERLMEYLKK